jgi:hypothetical protein
VSVPGKPFQSSLMFAGKDLLRKSVNYGCKSFIGLTPGFFNFFSKFKLLFGLKAQLAKCVSCGQYNKSFTIVIYNRNDSMISWPVI